MPLGGFVCDARLPALREACAGAEILEGGEAAMDADFRLGALSPPAFEMPFRTLAAFSNARVSSSSSWRSWGLGVHAMKAESHAVVPLHCPPGGVPHPGQKTGQGCTWRKVSGRGLPENWASSFVSGLGVGSGAGVSFGSQACSSRRAMRRLRSSCRCRSAQESRAFCSSATSLGRTHRQLSTPGSLGPRCRRRRRPRPSSDEGLTGASNRRAT